MTFFQTLSELAVQKNATYAIKLTYGRPVYFKYLCLVYLNYECPVEQLVPNSFRESRDIGGLFSYLVSIVPLGNPEVNSGQGCVKF